ncbi:amidase [Nocardia harenae]|uniref:amidase n=1 Tax=Nocardia harenae TaxID=358707 RepID=UPI00082A6075|nr:amidase [Nocardia harenae]
MTTDARTPAAARLHAFTDDALGEHDALALAALVRRGERSPGELAAAAACRAAAVAELNAVATASFADPVLPVRADGVFAGVPTFIKDNSDITGMPSNHGTTAFTAGPARGTDAYVREFLSTGAVVIGKSAMPEFGFNASAEPEHAAPTRNPWQPDRSAGGSSGGAAALVAAGVVPFAHGNDGGGSIRIPAASTGLVGLKPSRGRHADSKLARLLPLNIVSEGVLTRTVRDTAAFTAAIERSHPSRGLPPVGTVDGPPERPLRIGVLLESAAGPVTDPAVRESVRRVAELLSAHGHRVDELSLPFAEAVETAFLHYWALLAAVVSDTGKLADRHFDRSRLDGLTRGLRGKFYREIWRTPGALRTLARAHRAYEAELGGYDAVLTPTLGHTTPPLGHLAPTVPFDELLDRLRVYVGFTPLNNITGTPSISVPAGLAPAGVPLGVQFAGARGAERTLLQLAYLVEAELPFPRITATGS